MIRLFANIMAGHSIVIALTCLVFITAKMGAANACRYDSLFRFIIGVYELSRAARRLYSGVCVYDAFGRVYRTFETGAST